MIFESGISGIECLDPPPLGDVELKDAFKRVGSLGFIKGNIDSVNLLLKGSGDEILRDVQQMIKDARGFPGFILSTACSIAPGAERGKVRLLREIVDRDQAVGNI
jgi:uroporphyrinogen-III decarboxylase